ncbi:MAG TPA: response regulator transcription factor [Streptosporangiaceae bacterium]|nr:response regulator transcription factor [Streptosporangiaceae bacterium]
MAVRVLICDELPVVRDGLRTLLDSLPDIDVIETTGNGMEALAMSRSLRPDVVVTDLKLKGIPGLEMIRRLGKEDLAPPLRVVVFAMGDTDETMSDVLHAGASGLLSKDASLADLISAIRIVSRSQTMLTPVVTEQLVNWFRGGTRRSEGVLEPMVNSLTQREREVMMLIARGLSTDEIARELTIGVATVRTHVYRVRCKLGARDRAQLVSFAFRSGIMKVA